MKSSIRLSGKAEQVFKYLELLKRYKGNVTIKELAKGNKTLK
jgi:hypothetical protein